MYLEINNSPIKRPPTNEALEIVKKTIQNILLQIENDVFNNYLKAKKMYAQ